MASKTEIINMAMTRIGEKRIQNITDDNDIARTANAVYDIVLDECLANGPEDGWRFARQSTEIDADASDPDNGSYDYQYQIPNDCVPDGLLSVKVDDEELTDWIVEGQKILTNEEDETIDVTYIKRVTDTGRFPPWFVKVLYYSMAIQFALRRSAKDRLVDVLTNELEVKILPRAKGLNNRAMYVEEYNNDWQKAGRSGANAVDSET